MKGLFLGYILTTNVKRTHVIAFPGGLSALDVHPPVDCNLSGHRESVPGGIEGFPRIGKLSQANTLFPSRVVSSRHERSFSYTPTFPPAERPLFY